MICIPRNSMTRDKVWMPKASTTFGRVKNIKADKIILGYVTFVIKCISISISIYL